MFKPRAISSKLIVSTEDGCKRLNSFKVSKSIGPDSCQPLIMKETTESIKEPLQTVFNKTLKEGTLSEVWKNSYVTVLYENKAENLTLTIFVQYH